MVTFTSEDFDKNYQQATIHDYQLNQVYYKKSPFLGEFRPEEVKLTGNPVKDSAKFMDLAARGQAYLPTKSAPKKLASTKVVGVYKPIKTSELLKPLTDAAQGHEKDLANKSDKIKKSFNNK